jgi:guanylate kinase
VLRDHFVQTVPVRCGGTTHLKGIFISIWYNIKMSPDEEFEVQPPAQLMIVISGPSGAGKDTVVQLMKERGLPFHFVVTATTRPKRTNEVEGKDYFFVTKEEFARMIENNELIEYAFVYGDYKGIPRAEVQRAMQTGNDVVMRVDVQGAETVNRLVKDPVMIFITAENGDELERRLRERNTETDEELALRIATARGELKRLDEFDYVVVNRGDELDETINTICAIIDAEHHRVNPRKAEF